MSSSQHHGPVDYRPLPWGYHLRLHCPDYSNLLGCCRRRCHLVCSMKSFVWLSSDAMVQVYLYGLGPRQRLRSCSYMCGCLPAHVLRKTVLAGYVSATLFSYSDRFSHTGPPMTNLVFFVTSVLVCRTKTGTRFLLLTFLQVFGYSWQDTHNPSSANPGWGIDVAWRRFVLVVAGVTAAL
jgi:hypothetical protein